jgi:hypothetical protein
MKALLLAALLSLPLRAQTLKDLDFLVGTWGSQSDSESGECTFSRELGDQVLLRRSFADYPAQNGRPASHHEDLMVLYLQDGQWRADYWDNEGHRIAYGITRQDQQLRLLSQGKGPRFRLTYTPAGEDQLDLLFEIAPPGQEDFKPHLQARLSRR